MIRTITGGLAVFAAVSMALAGCSGGGPETAGPKTTPTAEKQDAGKLLPQSLKKIESESFKFTSTMTVEGQTIESSGAFDMAKKAGVVEVDMGKGTSLEMRIIGDDMYMTNLMDENKWMHLDLTKLPAGSTFGEAANPVANADFLFGVSDDVKKVGDNRYEGTLDLQKYLDEHATPEEKKKLEKSLGDLGPEAKKVPFEAVVDSEGRLTELKTTMTFEIKGEKTTMEQVTKFSDFGATVDVAKPPADKTEEAPAELYNM
ncbi:MAG: hypothetical protein ACRDTU_02335 [Micromonosporaceae bacterium]